MRCTSVLDQSCRDPNGGAEELGRSGCFEVGEVVDDSPAAQAGVRPGDLIVAVDGEPVETMGELQRLLVGERIGAP